MTDVIIPITMFGCVTAIIIFITARRHQERMELIKRGLNPIRIEPPKTGSYSLFFGLALVAVGLALIFGHFTGDNESETLLAGMIVLFGGISFITFWKLTAPDRERTIKAYELHMEREDRKEAEKAQTKIAETTAVTSQPEDASAE